MRFIPTNVDGCYVVEAEPHEDDRGFLARLWCADEFERQGLVASIAQVNRARTAHAGTIRGLHWQDAPYQEAKLVTCTRGRVFDVCADVRRDSPTAGAWAGVTLSADVLTAFYVPPGCAHGYQALEDSSEVLYSASAAYHPSSERGLRWDDPELAIDWPHRQSVDVSSKDSSWPDWMPDTGVVT